MLVQTPLVFDRFIPDFNLARTKRSSVKVRMKLVIAQVILPAVLVKLRNKLLLWNEEIFTDYDVRRFQEVREATRHHRHLLLNLLEVRRYHIPDILVPVFIGIVEVSSHTFQENDRKLVVKLLIQLWISFTHLFTEVPSQDTTKDRPLIVFPIGYLITP